MNESSSPYGHCRGCGTTIIAEQAGTVERREYCALCEKKRGHAPTFTMNLGSAGKDGLSKPTSPDAERGS